jgi:hypothetical protein
MIGISINTLFKELKLYFINLPNATLALGLLSITVISIFLLYLIFSRIVHKKETPFLRSRLSLIYSLISVGLLLVVFSVYHTKFTSLVYSKHLQSVLILEISLVLVYIGLLFKRIYSLLKKKDIRILRVKEGPIALNDAFLLTRLLIKNYRRSLWILLLPFLLLLVSPSSKYLYSIIFDNSTSMETQIAFAKASIENISEKIRPNSIFVLSSFPRCSDETSCIKLVQKLRTNIDSITTANHNDLVAETVVITNTIDLQSYVESDALETSQCGSPIFEAIWQNYVYAVDASQDVSINKKRMIILSDGEDNLYRGDFGFKRPKSCIFDIAKGNVSMNDFYDEITLIKYQGFGTDNITSTCTDLTVYEGSEASSFDKSFLDQMEDIYFDKYFLIIVFILLLIGIIFITNIK